MVQNALQINFFSTILRIHLLYKKHSTFHFNWLADKPLPWFHIARESNSSENNLCTMFFWYLYTYHEAETHVRWYHRFQHPKLSNGTYPMHTQDNSCLGLRLSSSKESICKLETTLHSHNSHVTHPSPHKFLNDCAQLSRTAVSQVSTFLLEKLVDLSSKLKLLHFQVLV